MCASLITALEHLNILSYYGFDPRTDPKMSDMKLFIYLFIYLALPTRAGSPQQHNDPEISIRALSMTLFVTIVYIEYSCRRYRKIKG
jgi:hypothetical protein